MPTPTANPSDSLPLQPQNSVRHYPLLLGTVGVWPLLDHTFNNYPYRMTSLSFQSIGYGHTISLSWIAYWMDILVLDVQTNALQSIAPLIKGVEGLRKIYDRGSGESRSFSQEWEK